MGRRSTIKELSVRLHGLPVGTLRQDGRGRLAFSYSDRWANHPDARAISLSLPLTPMSFDDAPTRAFFENLLPEDPNTRARIARVFEVSAGNPFALLGAIGRDCAGALQVVHPETPLVDHDVLLPQVEWLSESAAEKLVTDLPRKPLGLDPDGEFRFSLAGAQNKTAVVIDERGRIGLPRGDTPSTHIIKPPVTIGANAIEGIVENEHFCLRLAAALGLSAARSVVRSFAGIPTIVVDRYDRRVETGRIHRIHQEDFCQALGVPSDRKYEKDGGLSAVTCMNLLLRTDRPLEDRLAFVDALAFNFIIGGTDAHAKNYSLLHEPQVRMAPLYDIASGLVYGDRLPGNAVLAMRIGRYKAFEAVMPRHWDAFAADAKIGAEIVRSRISKLAARTTDLAGEVLSSCRREGLTAPLLDELAKIIKQRCKAVG